MAELDVDRLVLASSRLPLMRDSGYKVWGWWAGISYLCKVCVCMRRSKYASVQVFLPAPSCCWRQSWMSPAGSGDDRTRSPDVAWPRRSDPLSSVSSGRLRCPESPRCADSSPGHLRRMGKERDGGEKIFYLKFLRESKIKELWAKKCHYSDVKMLKSSI